MNEEEIGVRLKIDATFLGQKPALSFLDEPFGSVFKDGKRDKSLNTPDFNKKAKARRQKAKQAAKSRKTNRRR